MMMTHAKSDSDATSSSPSISSSPKRLPLYYVQSPSRDSNDGSDYNNKTPDTNSPGDSPFHSSSSFPRHSRESSASRFSGVFRGHRKRGYGNYKGWRSDCDVIEEEGGGGGDEGLMRRCQVMIALFVFLGVSSVFCFIIWGASRPFKPQISLQSLSVHNIYSGEGTDFTGVPTKLLSINCSVRMAVYNPASFFGIHVSSTSFTLMYSRIAIANGHLKKYYQPRKSIRQVTVNLQGHRVPLYGAGASFISSNHNGEIPMKILFEFRSQGDVVWKLVRSKHRTVIACSFDIVDSSTSKAIKFKHHSCTYD